MENKAIPATTTDPWGPGTTGMTLQQAVFAGIVHPGNLVAVRDIKTAAADPTAEDTAVFSAPASTFTLTQNANGSITVDSNGGIDGVDTLCNIENLRFCLATDPVTKACTAFQDVAAATVVVPGAGTGGLGGSGCSGLRHPERGDDLGRSGRSRSATPATRPWSCPV